MASYKVIQDIEAEEKLLGPLTLHQFIYAGIAAVCGFLTYFVVARGVGFLAIIFFPPTILAGFLAFPWGRDQPTEIWALAKLRFYLKPRKRTWDQTGAKELVVITAPKRDVVDYTGGLSSGEVKSRLNALAEMIDTHGWAIKGATTSYATPLATPQQQTNSDRLVAANFAAQSGPQDNIQASEDMLDEQNNPDAKRLTSMVEASSQARRQKIIEELSQTTPTPAPAQTATPTPVAKPEAPKPQPKPKAPQQPQNYWFLNQPSATAVPNDTVTFNTQVVSPGTPNAQTAMQTPAAASNQSEEAILHELQEHEKETAESTYNSHLPKVLPLEEQRKIAAQRQQADLAKRAAQAQAMPHQPTPQQQFLARNDDLDIATLARQADKAGDDGSVTISLR